MGYTAGLEFKSRIRSKHEKLPQHNELRAVRKKEFCWRTLQTVIRKHFKFKPHYTKNVASGVTKRWFQKLPTTQRIEVKKRKLREFGSGIRTIGLRIASTTRILYAELWLKLTKSVPSDCIVAFDMETCVGDVYRDLRRSCEHANYRSSKAGLR